MLCSHLCRDPRLIWLREETWGYMDAYGALWRASDQRGKIGILAVKQIGERPWQLPVRPRTGDAVRTMLDRDARCYAACRRRGCWPISASCPEADELERYVRCR